MSRNPQSYSARRLLNPAPRTGLAAVGHSARGSASLSWWLLILSAGLMALVVVPLLGLGVVYRYHISGERVLPGINVGNISVGSLTRSEAEAKLDAAWNHEKVLIATDGQRVWTLKPLDVGLWVDPQVSVDVAMQFGRGENTLRELVALVLNGSWTAKPAVFVNLDVTQAGLQRLSQQVNLPAKNATLRYVDGTWQPIPGQNGLTLNIEETERQIAADPRAIIAGGFLPLATQAVAPRVANAALLLERVQTALDRPLTINAYDPISNETVTWEVPRERLAEWLQIETQDENLTFYLDGIHLSAYLEEMKSSLGPDRTLQDFSPPPELSSLWLAGEPIDVLMRSLPTTYTVEPGDNLTRIGFKVGMPYWKIQQANPGIDMDRLTTGAKLTIPSKNEMLPLPIVLNKRIVISISRQRLWTYENGAQRSEHVISTGIDRSPTYPGVYQIQTHELNAYASVWDLYMPHFMGIYEGWPGFMNGIHGLPMLSSGVRLWGSVLGRPASYGCVILSLNEAEDLYNWAEAGVIVEIQP